MGERIVNSLSGCAGTPSAGGGAVSIFSYHEGYDNNAVRYVTFANRQRKELTITATLLNVAILEMAPLGFLPLNIS